MRKLLLIFVIAVLAVSCKNKELCVERIITGQPVRIVFDWGGGFVPSEKMRVNLFSLNQMPYHGTEEVISGDIVGLQIGAKVRTLAYNYYGNNLRFRNESNLELIEAYAPPLIRATYSALFPLEATYGEPASYFYIGDNPSFDVVQSDVVQEILLSPQDMIQTYTFRVEGIAGAEFIADTRGALAGVSSSIFISTRALSSTVSTVLFNATANKDEGVITGSFKTFGRIDGTINTFTIEILYPTADVVLFSGLIQKSWDVTSQIDTGGHHILITASGIEVPDAGGGGGETGGPEIDVGGWGPEILIPLN